MDALSDNYVRYYKLQSGGRLPVFYGQDGQGVGDVLKGAIGKIMPYVFPVVKGSVNDFLDTTEKLLAEGKSGKEIFKSAMKAGFKGGMTSAKDKFLEKIGLPAPESASESAQVGSGRKRKRRSTKRKGGKRRKTSKRPKVYKRPKRKGGKRKGKGRKLAFKTNF